MSRPVVVWRNSWLPASNTFVRNQADELIDWSAVPVGMQKVHSALAREADTIVFGRSASDRVREQLFRVTRRSRRVTAALRRSAPALIHAHFAVDAVLIAPIARRLNIPLVVTLHGHDVTAMPFRRGLKGWVYRRRLRSLFRQTALVIAVSEFIADCARALGAADERVRVHHIGIPIPAVEREIESTDEFDIVFVGRLVEKKGVRDLLAAVSRLDPPFRASRIAVVGSGPLESELRVLARDLGVDCSFLGLLPPEEVMAVMRRSKIFVGPSQAARSHDSEGLGMVFLEAAAAGIPSVSYRHGGVPEAIIDGVTGLLADEGDIAGLATRIESLLSDEELRTRLGRAARERVERDFDITRQTRLLEAIYDEAVSPVPAEPAGSEDSATGSMS